MARTSDLNMSQLPTSSNKVGTFPLRLKQVIGEESVRAFARRVKLSDTVLRQYLAGKSEPTRPALIAIASAAEVHVEWLATGEGPMTRGEYTDGSGRIAGTQCRYPVDQDEFVLVPRYDVQTSCGGGAAVESEQVVDHLAFKRRWVGGMGLQPDCLALISAKGDSMEPTIKDGFLLLVDMRQREIKADAIYVLRFNNELIAKRCQKLFTGELKVKSDNQAYDEQVVPADQVAKLEIIGRVVWGGGKM